MAGYKTFTSAADMGPYVSKLILELPEKVGVAAVPFAPFTDAFTDDWSHLVRFAFCKRPEVLQDAVERLHALRP